ncbi:hypothetical protein PWG15_01740 [Ensifer adhaerens]|nr:hypothetical protein [Ensifer adhaerens]WDZ77263.1 hypothetical protein PWG15_01740 [Ensifer adhaerens]
MFLDNLKRFRANTRRGRNGLRFSQAKENRALMANAVPPRKPSDAICRS